MRSFGKSVENVKNYDYFNKLLFFFLFLIHKIESNYFNLNRSIMKSYHLKKIILIVLLFCTIISAFAQENQSSQLLKMKKHEFNVSVGVFPIPLNPYNLVFEDFYFSGFFFGFVNKPENDSYSIPFSFNIRYFYNFNSKYSLGVCGVYSLKKIEDLLSTEYGVNIHVYSLFISNKFTYINKSNFSVYSSIGIGINYTNELSISDRFSFTEGTNYIFPDIQICLLGLNFAKSKILNMEIGYGAQGIFKVGVNF